jgi:hypothetical protein
MKFNSKSVTLNRGINLKVSVAIPPIMDSYQISDDVWNEAMVDFNKELDNRSQVSEIVDGVKVDVLRINTCIVGTVILWMMVKESDVEVVENMVFTLSGTVVFEDETSNVVEKVIVKDLFFGSPDGVRRSIFKKRKGLTLA